MEEIEQIRTPESCPAVWAIVEALEADLRAEIGRRAPTSDIDDLLQDARLECASAIARSQVRSLRGLARSIARRSAIDHARRRLRREKVMASGVDLGGVEDLAGTAGESGKGPVMALRAHLRGLLPHLSPRQRRVVAVALSGVRSEAQLAAEAGMRTSDVRKVLDTIARRIRGSRWATELTSERGVQEIRTSQVVWLQRFGREGGRRKRVRATVSRATRLVAL